MPRLHGIFETSTSAIIAMFQYYSYTYKLSSTTVTAIAAMRRWWCDHPRLVLYVVQFVATQMIVYVLGRRDLCGHNQVQICTSSGKCRMSIVYTTHASSMMSPLEYVNGDAFAYGDRSETHAQAARRAAVERERSGTSH
jgi:hypothetical protein